MRYAGAISEWKEVRVAWVEGGRDRGLGRACVGGMWRVTVVFCWTVAATTAARREKSAVVKRCVRILAVSTAFDVVDFVVVVVVVGSSFWKVDEVRQ